MIIAQQVQCSVQGEFAQLSDFAMSQRFGLMPGAVEGNDDLTKKPFSRWQLITIRKREHIGRSIDIAEPLVEFAYCLVAGEHEVNLDILCAQLPQTAGNHLS